MTTFKKHDSVLYKKGGIWMVGVVEYARRSTNKRCTVYGVFKWELSAHQLLPLNSETEHLEGMDCTQEDVSVSVDVRTSDIRFSQLTCYPPINRIEITLPRGVSANMSLDCEMTTITFKPKK